VTFHTSGQDIPAATTCDELRPVVCIYPGGNYTGAFQAWFPDAAGGFWISLTNDSGMTLPWGSFHDFSGSSVAFGDVSTGQRKCYVVESSAAYPSVTSYRYMWIEYGVKNCTGTLGWLP